MYLERPIKDYLDDLGARKPAPGGGSAAALMAALGTSLMSMVANYTIGKRDYKALENKVSDILAKAHTFDSVLRQLIDKDAAAYGILSEGLKKCKDDAAARDKLYKAAIEPPLLVCTVSHDCLELCKELVSCGNKGLITDTACAAIMFEGAFFSAKFNVYINLEHVTDMDYIASVHKTLQPLEEKMPQLKEEVLELCEEVINTAGRGDI